METSDSMTPNDSQQILETIGISKAAAKCYVYLSDQLPRAARAAELKSELQLPNTTLYRVLSDLENKGFIETIKIVGPAAYRAIALSDALDNYAVHLLLLARPIIRQQRLRSSPLSGTITRDDTSNPQGQ